MAVTRLVVEGFRNLRSVDVRFGDRVNLISGENGAGKTSLLEVLYTLAVGRSFRTRRFKNLISYNDSAFQLFAEFTSEGVAHRLGVERNSEGSSVFRLDGGNVASAGELATQLPCQIMNSHSFELLEGGPSERRAFLDWLVFHVKPEFRSVYSDYGRCIKQRNSLLRDQNASRGEFEPWNQRLAELGEQLDQYREEALCALEGAVQPQLDQCEFLKEGELSIAYQPGWDRSTSLLEQIECHFARDVALGYTAIGPHKADVRFIFNKKPVADVLSRGQQKILVAALYMAQIATFRSHSRRTCMFLVDDLPAELDANNVDRFFAWLSTIDDVQSFVTSIQLDHVLRFFNGPTNSTETRKLFHVKQGLVTEQ